MDDIILKRLLNSATWIDHLLIAAAGLAGVIVLLKLFSKDKFKFFDVEFSTSYAWVVFFIFTCAHVYVSFLFRSDISLILKKYPNLKATAWESLTGSDLFFFHGLLSRLQFVNINGVKVFVMEQDDPTTWLAHGGAILVFLAIIKVRETTWLVRVGSLIAALIITVANWLVGGGWVVYASYLI